VRVFLDANILFSASNPNWLTGKLLEKLAEHADLLTTDYAYEEAARNLASHHQELLPQLEALQGRLRFVPESREMPSGIALPEKDRPILAAAIRARSTHLLTGDLKHFGPLMPTMVEGVAIVSQRLMAEHLRDRGLL